MTKIVAICGHGYIGKTVLGKVPDAIIIEDTTSGDQINVGSTMPIHNYVLANKITEAKTGKELRRERRKQERKIKKNGKINN